MWHTVGSDDKQDHATPIAKYDARRHHAYIGELGRTVSMGSAHITVVINAIAVVVHPASMAVGNRIKINPMTTPRIISYTLADLTPDAIT
jgi:hypothetical protein